MGWRGGELRSPKHVRGGGGLGTGAWGQGGGAGTSRHTHPSNREARELENSFTATSAEDLVSWMHSQRYWNQGPGLSPSSALAVAALAPVPALAAPPCQSSTHVRHTGPTHVTTPPCQSRQTHSHTRAGQPASTTRIHGMFTHEQTPTRVERTRNQSNCTLEARARTTATPVPAAFTATRAAFSSRR